VPGRARDDDPTGLDAVTLVGLLADDDRRACAAALILGASTADEVARATGLSAAKVATALGRLAAAGLVVEAEAGGLHLLGSAFQRAARNAKRRAAEAEGLDPSIPPDLPAGDAKVLHSFVRDGRLLQIPTARGKRLVVLDWLAQDLEPGRRYSEQMINLVIGKRHADTAALRRYLVDEGFLDRADRQYWRTGGTVPDEP
jgi:hypothetical protein